MQFFFFLHTHKKRNCWFSFIDFIKTDIKIWIISLKIKRKVFEAHSKKKQGQICVFLMPIRSNRFYKLRKMDWNIKRSIPKISCINTGLIHFQWEWKNNLVEWQNCEKPNICIKSYQKCNRDIKKQAHDAFRSVFWNSMILRMLFDVQTCRTQTYLPCATVLHAVYLFNFSLNNNTPFLVFFRRLLYVFFFYFTFILWFWFWCWQYHYNHTGVYCIFCMRAQPPANQNEHFYSMSCDYF